MVHLPKGRRHEENCEAHCQGQRTSAKRALLVQNMLDTQLKVSSKLDYKITVQI